MRVCVLPTMFTGDGILHRFSRNLDRLTSDISTFLHGLIIQLLFYKLQGAKSTGSKSNSGSALFIVPSLLLGNTSRHLQNVPGKKIKFVFLSNCVEQLQNKLKRLRLRPAEAPPPCVYTVVLMWFLPGAVPLLHHRGPHADSLHVFPDECCRVRSTALRLFLLILLLLFLATLFSSSSVVGVFLSCTWLMSWVKFALFRLPPNPP